MEIFTLVSLAVNQRRITLETRIPTAIVTGLVLIAIETTMGRSIKKGTILAAPCGRI